MPTQRTKFVEVSAVGAYVDIEGLPDRVTQIVVNSQDFSSDFYVRKKGTTPEKYISKNSEWYTEKCKEGSYIDTTEDIYQIKGTGTFVVEYSA